MVTSCLCHARLPAPSPSVSASDSVSVSVKQCLSVATRYHHAPAAAANGKLYHHSPGGGLHRKFSSSFHGSRAPKLLTLSWSAQSDCRKMVLLCAVASLASTNRSSIIKVEGKLPEDFSPWQDENVDMKKQAGPIQYGKGDPPTNVNAPGRRIVAIGDVHGDLARTEWALQLAGVLSSDGYGRWIGGNTVCVQMGDILDRGEDEIAIMSLLHNLGQQARLMGGAVFQINGNHETMNVEGDYRFVEPGGFAETQNFTIYCEEEHAGDYEAAFSGWYLASKQRKASWSRPFMVSWIMNPLKMRKGAAARDFLFSPSGFLAQKLSQHGVVLKVNDWLFAHGGILPHHVEYGLEKLNEEVTQWMRGDPFLDGSEGNRLPFMAIRGYNSIVWSRLYSRDDYSTAQDRINACAMLETTLESVGAKALVVGHTPQAYGANSECKGRVWRIDVGMSSGVLNAKPQVLEINGNDVHVLIGGGCEEEDTTSVSFTDLQL